MGGHLDRTHFSTAETLGADLPFASKPIRPPSALSSRNTSISGFVFCTICKPCNSLTESLCSLARSGTTTLHVNLIRSSCGLPCQSLQWTLQGNHQPVLVLIQIDRWSGLGYPSEKQGAGLFEYPAWGT